MSNLGHDGCLEERARLLQRIAALEVANRSLEQSAAALARVVVDERLGREAAQQRRDQANRDIARMRGMKRQLIVLAKSLGATSDQLLDVLRFPRDTVEQ